PIHGSNGEYSARRGEIYLDRYNLVYEIRASDYSVRRSFPTNGLAGVIVVTNDGTALYTSTPTGVQGIYLGSPPSGILPQDGRRYTMMAVDQQRQRIYASDKVDNRIDV